MEALFRQVGIYSHASVSSTNRSTCDTLLYYKEAKNGQILEEGITEAGSMSSFIAAGTAYANSRHQHDSLLYFLLDVRVPANRRLGMGRRRYALPRLPGRRYGRPHDAGRRGLAASGRPQPSARASPVPNLMATIRPSPMRLPSSFATASGACTSKASHIFYYLTVMNENYAQPPEMPADGHSRGHPEGPLPIPAVRDEGCQAARPDLFGSGTIMNRSR